MRDERIDEYIAKATDFAQPILKHIRELIHSVCPDVQETIKWGFPHYDYKGIMISTPAFKKHMAMSFWKGEIMNDNFNILDIVGETSMGWINQIKDRDDLPPDEVLIEYIKEAVDLNERQVPLPKKEKKPKKDLEIPEYFLQAVNHNQKAKATFEAFNSTHKREYVEWVVEAKREETRQKRLQQAIETMEQGKSKNWKYLEKK